MTETETGIEKKGQPAAFGSRLQGRCRYAAAGLVLLGIIGLGFLPAPEEPAAPAVAFPQHTAEREAAATAEALVPVRRDRALRNPFGAVAATATPKEKVVATAIPLPVQAAPVLPQWRGILQGQTETLVLLEYEGTARTLGCGEHVGPYTVQAITANTVRIVGNGAEYILHRTEE